MAYVQVLVENNSGQKVGFTFDEDDERIEQFRKMAKREELAKVDVKKLPARPAAKSDEK